MQKDADLFLDWAADEFLAAGRADEADERRAHRAQAEMFWDIFNALNQGQTPVPPKKPDPMIGKLLERAFTPAPKAARS